MPDEIDIPGLLGEVVRKRRADLGLRQEDLASACGWKPSYLGRIERGELNPGVSQVFPLARGLDLRATALIAALEAKVDQARRPG